MSSNMISLAVPKGRLQEQTQKLFAASGFGFNFKSRELTSENINSGIRAILVKNTDLPTYVSHGIAGLGVCGDDLLAESRYDFFKLLPLPFGSTKMCIAGFPDNPPWRGAGQLTIATKFTRFAREYFHQKGIPVEIIKLNGSVELAPILGLAPYIVDLVETGNTLRENNLQVIEELATMRVHLVANPAYYKIHYHEVNQLVETLKKGIE
jgi:ATP phosphoribosyltransferase